MTIPADSPTRFPDVALKWRARRDEYVRLGATVNAGALIDEVLADLDRALTVGAQEMLTLEQAAARTGYSTEHLRKLVSAEVIPNAGRKGAPRIAPEHLPTKARRRVASSGRPSYDPETDVRLLRGRRKGGHNGS